MTVIRRKLAEMLLPTPNLRKLRDRLRVDKEDWVRSLGILESRNTSLRTICRSFEAFLTPLIFSTVTFPLHYLKPPHDPFLHRDKKPYAPHLRRALHGLLQNPLSELSGEEYGWIRDISHGSFPHRLYKYVRTIKLIVSFDPLAKSGDLLCHDMVTKTLLSYEGHATRRVQQEMEEFVQLALQHGGRITSFVYCRGWNRAKLPGLDLTRIVRGLPCLQSLILPTGYADVSENLDVVAIDARYFYKIVAWTPVALRVLSVLVNSTTFEGLPSSLKCLPLLHDLTLQILDTKPHDLFFTRQPCFDIWSTSVRRLEIVVSSDSKNTMHMLQKAIVAFPGIDNLSLSLKKELYGLRWTTTKGITPLWRGSLPNLNHFELFVPPTQVKHFLQMFHQVTPWLDLVKIIIDIGNPENFTILDKEEFVDGVVADVVEASTCKRLNCSRLVFRIQCADFDFELKQLATSDWESEHQRTSGHLAWS
ncbi:hypothetical protein BT69DRAFT_1374671 [Atractiella rhizophila]|nr:hypothetical protein BT69DRAFT_1374671 [Atractiella rhizophila]